MPMASRHRACPPELRPLFDELVDGFYQRKEIFQSAEGPPLTLPTHTAIRCYEGQVVIGRQAWENLQAFHANVFHRAFRYSRRGKTPELVILHEPVISRSQQLGKSFTYWVDVRLISLR